ncbi:MAG: ferrous iron transport protein B [archaeon]
MNEKKLRIVLAGNANVGKSVLFNALTGMHQHIGNWPGKTIEKAEGTFYFHDYLIDVIDLPGIYSLSTFSIEEKISRDYIALENPDVVINVIDASVLERNLFFTLQLIEMGAPLVVALNQVDLAKKKGITIDHEKLSELLGVSVVPTVAIKDKGISALLAEVVSVSKQKQRRHELKYGKQVEEKISEISRLLKKHPPLYPPRWMAIKLLEKDHEITKQADSSIVSRAGVLSKQLEKIHGETSSAVISGERYFIASGVAKKTMKKIEYKETRSDRVDYWATHRIFGYPIMLFSVLLTFFAIFSFGNYASELMVSWFANSHLLVNLVFGSGALSEIVWSALEGLIAGVTIALPYIIPFYVALSLLEDTGYLSRVAFLTDKIMHQIGLHGKAFIPLILGFGCNVPACLGCRIMERYRERFITAFLATLVPCAARTVIIMGLVAAYVGFEWAIALYLFDILIIFLLGKLANRVMPGEPVGLILEMHALRKPSIKIAFSQAWFRVKDFITVAFPIIIASSIVIKIFDIFGLLTKLSDLLSPVTVGWLGLPSIVGLILIFGILRKELILIMLATLVGTTNFASALSPLQMLTLAIVTMLYVPCVATIVALKKEFGWKKAIGISAFEVFFAILVAGLVMRVLAFAVF